MQSHAYRRPARGGQPCKVCGSLPGAVVHLLALPGMETAEMEREQARGLTERMELEERMRTVKADISGKTGEMKRNAPLFYGTSSYHSVLTRSKFWTHPAPDSVGAFLVCSGFATSPRCCGELQRRPRISAHADLGARGGGGGVASAT